MADRRGHRRVNRLNAKFDWGFSQLIAGIGRTNDSLEELIATAKTPAETWAYEQHEIARDAIRRELYPERRLEARFGEEYLQ